MEGLLSEDLIGDLVLLEDVSEKGIEQVKKFESFSFF
jgi:hypothetical protein